MFRPGNRIPEYRIEIRPRMARVVLALDTRRLGLNGQCVVDFHVFFSGLGDGLPPEVNVFGVRLAARPFGASGIQCIAIKAIIDRH